MIKFLLLIVLIGIASGFYFGVFNSQDDISDIINKSKNLVTEQVDNIKEKSIDKAKEIKEKTIETIEN